MRKKYFDDMKLLISTVALGFALLLSNCTTGSRNYIVPAPSMDGPTVAERNAKIAQEERGDYYVGRRYYTQNTRFWGYLRKPGQPWSQAELVVFNEWKKKAPDRRMEGVKGGYGFDSNYEYKIYGYYSGDKVYEPNSDQFLKEFVLTGYEVTDENPGWLFSPSDRYDLNSITLRP